MVQGLTFARQRNIFTDPIQNEVVPVIWVNLMDPNVTLLPQFTEELLIDLCSGPYQVGLARGYSSAYQVEDTIAAQGAGGGYVNPDQFNTNSNIMLNNIPAYLFDQNIPPFGWDPNRFGPFEPFRVVVIPEIPSRYRSGRLYKLHSELSIMRKLEVHRLP